jgi:cytosine permease
MVALIVIVTWMAIRHVGSFEALFGMKPLTETMTFTAAVTAVVGTFASGGTQASNWSRFARTPKIGFIAGILAFFVGNGIMVFTGMMGGFAYQTNDLLEVMFTMGLTFWALIILTLNIWTTNNAAAYAFGVAGAEMFGKENKGPFIVGGVIIATIVAVAGVGAYFIPMLGFFGTFIPPLGGVIIGDFLFSYKRKIPKLDHVGFKKLRVAPLLAYVCGCAAAHFGALFDIGVPSLQGIIVAVFCVPLFNAVFKAVGFKDRHKVNESADYI